MNTGKPLICVTPGDKVWRLKDCVDNCGHFGIMGTSLDKRSFLPKLSRRSGFGEKAATAQVAHACKILDPIPHFRNTNLTPRESGAVSNLIKPGVKYNGDVGENSYLERTQITNIGTFYDSKKRGGISRSARQKTYLRMVLSRSSGVNSERKEKNFDEDYLSLDDELFSRYLNEESELEHSSFVSRELRSGVKSSKCRLQMKCGETAPDKRFVKYGR